MICIKIDDRDQVLHQWDTGQRLVLRGVPGGAKVDFYHEGEEPLGRESYEEDGAVYADIPDVLLQAESKLYACVRVQDETVGETVYKWFATVYPRPKPSDYIYTEEEKKTWEELQAQIDELKENGAGGGTADAVQYIAQKLTEDQQMQARRNLGLYGKRTELSKTEVYRYFYVGWWEGSGTLTEIPNGRSYLISVLDAEYACTSYSKTHKWSEQTTGYIGNVELIPEDVRSAYSFDESCSVDCPVVLYQVNSGSLTVVIDPDLTVPVAGGATFYELGNPVEVVDTIPEEYLPEGYGSGGYYTPSVSQPTEDTMQVDFTPSSEDMPAVEPVTVTLPVGPAGEPGDDGLTPYIGANGNWWIGDTDTGVSASASGGVVVQAEEPEDTDVLWIDTDDDDEPEETDTGTDKSLGITGAEVGQTVRITEVDENGVPTAWEAVESVSDSGWTLINEALIEEDLTSDGVTFTECSDGCAIDLSKYSEILVLIDATGTSGGGYYPNCVMVDSDGTYRVFGGPVQFSAGDDIINKVAIHIFGSNYGTHKIAIGTGGYNYNSYKQSYDISCDGWLFSEVKAIKINNTIFLAGSYVGVFGR